MSVPYLQTATVVIDIVKALGTGGVLAVLLGTTGLGGLATAVIAWKKQPVERRDADLAVAEASQGMSLELAQELRTEIGRLRAEIDDLRTELRAETGQRKQLGDEIQAYKGTIYRLRVALSRAQDYFDHVTTNWGALRQHETPPMFPTIDVED